MIIITVGYCREGNTQENMTPMHDLYCTWCLYLDDVMPRTQNNTLIPLSSLIALIYNGVSGLPYVLLQMLSLPSMQTPAVAKLTLRATD